MFGLFLMGSSVSSDAAATGAQGSGFGSTIIMIVLLFAMFYFLLIRPQKKRDAEAKKMMEALKKGDKIITIGGIKGTVAAVTDKTVFVRVDDNTKIEFTKTAISQVLNAASPAPAKVEKKQEKKAEVEAPKAEAKVEEPKAEAPKAAAPEKKAPAAKKAPAEKATK